MTGTPVIDQIELPKNTKRKWPQLAALLGHPVQQLNSAIKNLSFPTFTKVRIKFREKDLNIWPLVLFSKIKKSKTTLT